MAVPTAFEAHVEAHEEKEGVSGALPEGLSESALEGEKQAASISAATSPELSAFGTANGWVPEAPIELVAAAKKEEEVGTGGLPMRDPFAINRVRQEGELPSTLKPVAGVIKSVRCSRRGSLRF